METKIQIEVVCVHCGKTLNLNKRKSQQQCKLVCPACSHNLHILFDTDSEPQTYSFLSVDPSRNKKKQQSFKTEETKEEEVPKQHKDKTVYKKKIEKEHREYEGIPHEDEYEEEKSHSKKKRKLTEPLFLTRSKMFGLVKERFRLYEGKNIIGREDWEQPSDISLAGDNTISRRSICIEVKADDYGFDYILTVLNASNPVRLNGKQIFTGDKTYIDFGDIIRVGHTDLKFDNK